MGESVSGALMMRRVVLGVLAGLVAVVGVFAAPQEPVDQAAIAKIRDEGLNRSKVDEPFDMFVNVIGPRLTASPAHKRAAEYARDTLTRWGLSNARLEPWTFGRGWELTKLTIEMVEPQFNQMQVQTNLGVDFAAGIRTLMRQDPDIIMVGEIRDLETAEMAIQAALTGHLVMSTLHTNDAPSTITRLLDLGVPSYLLSSTVLGVMAQRLVRVLCPACKEKAPLEDSAWELLVSPWKAQKPETTYVAKGCLDCRMTGYAGRMGIYEIMVLNNDIRSMITDKTDMEKLRVMLGIDKWLILGGSWGATLAMAYVQHEPEAIAGVLLRAPFLASEADLQWFCVDAGRLRPQAHAHFTGLPALEGLHGGISVQNLLPAYADAFARDDVSALNRWLFWEATLEQVLRPPSLPSVTPPPERLSALLARARIQTHYLRHQCFLDTGLLLDGLRPLAALPCAIVQGELDWVCPPANACAVQQAWPGAALHMVSQGTHSPFQGRMPTVMSRLVFHFVAHGRFPTGDCSSLAQACAASC